MAFLSLGIFEIDNLRPVLGLGVVPMLKGIKTATLAFLGPEIMLLLVAFMYPSDKSKSCKGCTGGYSHTLALLCHHGCDGHWCSIH